MPIFRFQTGDRRFLSSRFHPRSLHLQDFEVSLSHARRAKELRVRHQDKGFEEKVIFQDPTPLCVLCPLCKAEKVLDFFQDKRRNYLRCQVCNLVFVPPSQFLSAADEKGRYDLHQNSPYDLNYRQFLSQLFIPMQNCLNLGSYGLDFGSGPEPTLSVMFEEAGHFMTIFDCFYANIPSALEKKYDFITATEVVEHLHHPIMELERLWACLKHGGILGIMTKLAPDQDAFSSWHYKNDPTHVCFFSQFTFKWLADQWGAELTFADKDVVIFSKKSLSSEGETSPIRFPPPPQSPPDRGDSRC